MLENNLDQDALVQLVYVSAATTPFGSEQLETLLQRARSHNATLGISGVLLFHEGTFFQVLEGKRADVQGLFDMIVRDPRHNNVLVLVQRETDHRNFGNWSMGFIRSRQAMQKLPGFVDFFNGRTFIDLAGDSQRIHQILDGFRRGRWRRSATNETRIAV